MPRHSSKSRDDRILKLRWIEFEEETVDDDSRLQDCNLKMFNLARKKEHPTRLPNLVGPWGFILSTARRALSEEGQISRCEIWARSPCRIIIHGLLMVYNAQKPKNDVSKIRIGRWTAKELFYRSGRSREARFTFVHTYAMHGDEQVDLQLEKSL